VTDELFGLEKVGTLEPQQAEGEVLEEALLRACVSMRGHLNTSLSLLRDFCSAVRLHDTAALRALMIEAEALVAENELLNMNIYKTPSFPKDGRLTMKVLEGVVGTQRARLSVRNAKKGLEW
jgi:hypothetical protein